MKKLVVVLANEHGVVSVLGMNCLCLLLFPICHKRNAYKKGCNSSDQKRNYFLKINDHFQE